MAFIANDLLIVEDALRQLASGKRITEVRFSDRTVQYEAASMKDLLSLRQNIQSELANSDAQRRSRQVRLYSRGKGI